MKNIKGQKMWRDDVILSNEDDGSKTVIESYYLTMICSHHSELDQTVVKLVIHPAPANKYRMYVECIQRIPFIRAKPEMFAERFSEWDVKCDNKECPLLGM